MRKRDGFTLIELMISIAIIGVLASVAIPAYSGFVMRSKSSEVYTHLGSIYQGIASYWERPFSNDQGLGATTSGHCLTNECCTGGTTIPPFPPTQEKRQGDYNEVAMKQVGFSPGPTYAAFAWAIPSDSLQGQCGLDESDFDVLPGYGPLAYSLISVLDLDGDGKMGGAVLHVGIRGETMYRAPSVMTLSAAFALEGNPCPFCAAAIAD
ncbi:MAG: prepilin-type N-terminal cleavage/methylation domain-containing protein [Myxococcales bacterium]|nr:prepilin-type N-terminal cleavage/methylation domain-containing protein [Myxococcales bacterium]